MQFWSKFEFSKTPCPHLPKNLTSGEDILDWALKNPNIFLQMVVKNGDLPWQNPWKNSSPHTLHKPKTTSRSEHLWHQSQTRHDLAWPKCLKTTIPIEIHGLFFACSVPVELQVARIKYPKFCKPCPARRAAEPATNPGLGFPHTSASTLPFLPGQFLEKLHS